MIVPLHVHSEYSLTESCIKIEKLVKKAADLKYRAIALTDHNTMAGLVSFYRLCRQYNLKPILGLEVDITGLSVADQIVLLAENNTGYENLLQLASHEKPVPLEVLKDNNQGLIGLVSFNNCEDAPLTYHQLTRIFGKENIFIELLADDSQRRAAANQLYKMFPVEVFAAAQSVYYLEPDELELIRLLRSIKYNKKAKEIEVIERPLLAPDVICRDFGNLPQAIKNTVKIAERCQVKLRPEIRFPKLPESVDLKEIVLDGAKKRYGKLTDSILERLHYELDVIEEMGFTDYFLIVADIVRYGKAKGIPIGPGRGSSAGSLTAYCLNITDIDPLRHQLLFERFLNKKRHNLPDIDLDICCIRREEIIDYCINRFGKEHVAKIGVYGTFGYAQANSEMKKRFDRSNPSLANKLVGLKQYFSTHAAGLIITPEPVIKYSAVEIVDGIYVTQLTMDVLEELGVLKIDLLGLRNLTILHQIQQLINLSQPDFSLKHIPIHDERTFELLGRGETLGIFQLESRLFTNILTRLRPRSFSDLTALLALGRPGPLKQIPRYIKRRDGQERIKYIHPRLESILADTYGLMIYQEQVMQVAHEIAGFSLEEADLLRVAISKKDGDLIKKLRSKFIQGCEKNGLNYQVSNKLYLEIEQFAGYAFNKAHSTAYAKITWQLAYLKTHYPIEFYLAQLKNITNVTKIGEFYQECKIRGIRILLPDIRYSEVNHVKEGNSIRIGLTGLKHIGETTAEAIIIARTQKAFSNVEDFFRRAALPMRTQYILAYGGALDGFGERDEIIKKIADFHNEALPVINQLELLEKEKEIVGIYLSAHPVDRWINFLDQLEPSLGTYAAGHISEVHEYNQEVTGVISNIDSICKFSLAKEKYEFSPFLKHNALAALFGRFQDDNLEIEWVLPLQPMLVIKPKINQINQLQKLLSHHQGTTPVILNLDQGVLQLVASRFWLNPDQEIISKLENYASFFQWIDPWESRFLDTFMENNHVSSQIKGGH